MQLLELMCWALYCHTPWILKTAFCLQRVVLHSSYTDGIQIFPVLFLRWAPAQYHLIQRLCYVALSRLPVVLHCHQVACWRAWRCLFAEGTGLIVGRTLVDPSQWKIPVLVSNFSQETIVVDPFTEVGMITQVTAIHCVTEPPQQSHSATGALLHHLQDLVEQTCRDLDPAKRRRLAAVLLEYSNIFPMPGAPLTGHTDAVEHDINTGDRPLIRCAPRRMSPQKMKQEEECVREMLTGGQIEPSDSPWSSPVVLVTKKKDDGTRF